MSTIRTGTTTTTAISVTGDTTGTLTLTADSGIVDASTTTGGFIPPSGTTAQRPSSPASGTIRFNTSTNVFEVYDGIWQTLASLRPKYEPQGQGLGRGADRPSLWVSQAQRQAL